MREECAAEMGLDMLILTDRVVADQHRAWKIAKEASQGASLPTIDVLKYGNGRDPRKAERCQLGPLALCCA